MLASWKIDSIDKLESLGRSYGKLLKEADEYRPPPDPAQSSMPQAAYQTQVYCALRSRLLGVKGNLEFLWKMTGGRLLAKEM